MAENYKDLLPPLSTDEQEALRASIKADGVRDAIFVDENGVVLDGHHRLKFAPNAPRRTVEGLTEAEKQAFVFQSNLARRNLSPVQRAEVRGKMIAVAKALREESPRRNTQQRVAALLGVARETVRDWFIANGGAANPYKFDARRARRAVDAEIFDRAEKGERQAQIAADENISQAQVSHIVAAERKRRRNDELKRHRPAPPKGKFRVFYADPPWEYSDRRTGLRGYTGAEDHYPTMRLDELCTMKVADLAEDDAVLFLWTTSPMLEDAFKVIRAWGFEYKSSFIWDKVRHNFGHYNSVRHEFLLVNTRGSCMPDSKKLVDSVQVVERTAKHSQKPKEFRAIIEKLYQRGRKLELFARQDVQGWTTYGNELQPLQSQLKIAEQPQPDDLDQPAPKPTRKRAKKPARPRVFGKGTPPAHVDPLDDTHADQPIIVA